MITKVAAVIISLYSEVFTTTADGQKYTDGYHIYIFYLKKRVK